MRGNSGSEPPKTLDEHGLSTGGQRWRFIPLHKRLSSTSARPAALPTPDYTLNLAGISPTDTSFSHFAVTLAQQSDDNLTERFVRYAEVVRPLSLSLPLVYRNRARIVDISLKALSVSVEGDGAGDAVAAIAACLSALVTDLGAKAIHPFLPNIIEGFADVLHQSNQTTATAGAQQRENSRDTATIRHHHSLFWQPEVALVPIFSVVSHLTKTLLQRLVANPAKMVEHLKPLLSHPHYRVREMTAEACVGYVVRKTRDTPVRDALVCAVVGGVGGDSDGGKGVVPFADGLGVSLFEAVRLPSGRLHSRVVDVLRVAFRRLGEQSGGGGAFDGALSVVCRCFASLCRYIAAVSDAQAVASLLLEVCEGAAAAGNDGHIANVVFVLGKWVHHGGRTLVNLIGVPLCQRLLNGIAQAVEGVSVLSTRLVCEALQCICAVYRHTTEAFRERSVRSAMAATLERVAKVGDGVSLSACVRVLLDDGCVEFSRTSHYGLSRGVAAVCDRLAGLDMLPDGETGAKLALPLALAYLRALSVRAEQACRVFNSPKLRSLVLGTLGEETRCRGDSSDVGQFLQALEYLSFVPVPGCVPLLGERVKECGVWGLDVCAMFFKSCVRQLGSDEGNSDALRDMVRKVVRDSLLHSETVWQSDIICCSVSRCVEVFKLDFASELTVKEVKSNSMSLVSLSHLRRALMRNLSSGDSSLRQASISLIVSLGDDAKAGKECTASSAQAGPEDENDVEAAIRAIRDAQSTELPLETVSLAVLSLSHVKASLDGIGSRMLLLQELGRIVGKAKDLDDDVIFMLTHFTLGLFRMPLKALWKPAGDLFCAVASHNDDVMMAATLTGLASCEAKLLEEYRSRIVDDEGTEEGEDADTTEGKDNEDGSNLIAAEEKSACVINDADNEISSASEHKRKRRMESKHYFLSKRQRAKKQEAIRLHWDTRNWEKYVKYMPSDVDIKPNEGHSSPVVNGSTDELTFAIEVVRTIAKEPKYTTKVRERIVTLYLNLPPTLFGRNRGNSLAQSFTSLLEKMGGLKCCGTNNDMEEKMRCRLLSDLSRAAPLLQSSVLKCLCASRSDYLKRYRESFLRLIDESTFRDELAIVTDTHFEEWSMSNETVFSVEQQAIMDVLVRICFSKLTGGKGGVDARKSSVLSFLTSKLPWNISLPLITDLLVAPLKDIVEELENSKNEGFQPSGEMPVPAVLRGILGSIEAVVKHCRRTLPSVCWRKLAFATLLLNQNAGAGTGGQNVRAKSLRLLSTMIELRPDDTASVTSRVLVNMRAKVGTSGGTSVNGTPALLSFLASIFKKLPLNNVDCLFEKHPWSVHFSLRVVKSPRSDVRTITLACNVLQCFISFLERRSAGKCESDMSVMDYLPVLDDTADTMVVLVSRLTEAMDGNRGEQRKWSSSFGELVEVVQRILVVSSTHCDRLKCLIPVFSLFIQNNTVVFVPPSLSLNALASIVRAAVSGNEADVASHGIDVAHLLPLLSTRRFIRNGSSYTSLCRLISLVGGKDLAVVSQVLIRMNAMNASKIGEPDLDERISGLSCVTEAFKTALGGSDDKARSHIMQVGMKGTDTMHGSDVCLGAHAVMALVHGSVAAVYCNDIAVRGTAGYVLKLIARWVGFAERADIVSVRSALLEILLSAVVSSRNILHRREFSIALGELTRCTTSVSEPDNSDVAVLFKHFKSLTSPSDLDADFFENLVHLQAHRRGRALRQLEKHLSESSTEDAGSARNGVDVIATRLVMPLAIRMAVEKPNMDETKRGKNAKHFMSKEDAQKDVATWAVEVVGVVSSMVGWEQYRTSLDGLLARIASQKEDQDIVIVYRLLVKVAEAFPRKTDTRYPDGNTAVDYLVNTLLPKMLPHVSSGAMTDDLVHEREKPTVRFVEVGGRKEKGQSSFRAPVAIAMGQLMAQLPEDSLETLLPLLITPLTAALRSRMLSTRESAKHALTSVVLAIGPKYLSYVLRQVLSVLKEGFRKDLCIYVIHSILLGIQEFRNSAITENQAFEVDGCVHFLVTYILAELNSGVEETRKDFEDPNASDARQRQATARASKACECAELLGELINCKTSFEALCKPFLDSAQRSRSGKLSNRLTDLLQRLLLGILRNKSLSVPDAFKFCYELVADDDEGVDSSDEEVKCGDKKDSTQSLPKVKLLKSCNFGLQLLNSVLSKNGSILSERSVKARELHSMCGPFLSLSVSALKTGQDELTLTAFRVLQKLLKLPLAGRAAVAEEMSSIVVDILSSHSNGVDGDLSATSELFNTCLRAAAVLVKEVGSADVDLVSKDRINTLLAISCNCIQNGSIDCRSAAIALLRSVVGGRFVLPSVYDTMEKVNELAIHSQSSSLRTACISVSVLFLLTFPMGAKRTRQHMEFFVRNVNYELPSGRMAALQAIKELIAKFDPEVLEREGEYLFVALTANVARDTDPDCRNMAYSCVQLVFERLPPGRSVPDLLKLGVALIGVQCPMTSDVQPQTAAEEIDATVLRCGCTSLSAACNSGRLTSLQLRLVVWSVVVAMQSLKEDGDWETWYALLSCVDTAFKQQDMKGMDPRRLERQAFLRPLWEKMETYGLHRNQWVRLVAGRLVGSHLSACGGRNAIPLNYGENDRRPSTKVNGSVSASKADCESWCVWDASEVVRGWVKSFCLQLEADEIAVELGKQCLKNVICMADVVRKHPSAGDIGVDEEEDEGDGEENIEVQSSSSRMLRWLMARFCGLAVRGGREPQDLLRRACALRFLLVTATWWGVEIVSEFKRHFVLPVVQVLESGDLKETDAVNEKEGIGKGFRARQRNAEDKREGDENGDGDRQEEDGVGAQTVRTIAANLQAALVGCMGSDAFYEVYHELQTRKAALKAERKRKAAMLAAVDPERAAKRKRIKATIRKLRKRGVDAAAARERAMEKAEANGEIGGNDSAPGDEDDNEVKVAQVIESERQKRMLTADL